ncbi:Apocytochrome f [Dendrobium catenatum]|uniref:Apocytochrome f n=1 Tax=Dendrobium catenatum TaxID=906689 RepID=A0A2I0V6M6_9ASPA|nr:Apocytochrome f [Dendrobium catenatum]
MDIEVLQVMLPDTVFEAKVQVPYDMQFKQVLANDIGRSVIYEPSLAMEAHSFVNVSQGKEPIKDFVLLDYVQEKLVPNNTNELIQREEVNLNSNYSLPIDSVIVIDQNTISDNNNVSIFVEPLLVEGLFNKNIINEVTILCEVVPQISTQVMVEKITSSMINNVSNMEGDVFYWEGELPLFKRLSCTINESKILLNDHYHRDAFTDTEDMDIMSKCFARDDNDISFSKGHGRREGNVCSHGISKWGSDWESMEDFLISNIPPHIRAPTAMRRSPHKEPLFATPARQRTYLLLLPPEAGREPQIDADSLPLPTLEATLVNPLTSSPS